MHPEKWQQAQEVFDQVMAAPSAERSVLLQQLCGDDRELSEEIRSLLRAFGAAGSFLEPSSERLSDGVLPNGYRLGAYEVLRPLGRGGFSDVYLGARADASYHKRVAIKIVRRSLVDVETRKRFATERQILASLDHPHIARLLDGGATVDGLPYLVLEYVDGVRIDRFCDQQGLTVEERLELFCCVCEAVEHAHRNLIVHRDLKPSNILVTADGTPKLLDFGIAKLLNPEMMAGSLAPTMTWRRALTPHYASPEQLLGRLVTTSSDVYSLGVLLYKLLTGSLPHRLDGLSMREAEDLLLTATPIIPSQRPFAADLRLGLDPARLRRRLRGDLDNIVTKALCKEQKRRYLAAIALADDVRRHLQGLPVDARSHVRFYRLRKFVSRNWLAVSAVVMIFLLILGFAISSSMQSATLERQKLAAERQREKSDRMLEFMTGVFSTANPFAQGGKALSVPEMLDQAVEKLADLEDQPEARVELMLTLGGIFAEYGLQDRAAALFEEALPLNRSITGAAGREWAEHLGTLGIALRQQGRYEEAESYQRQALLVRRQITDDEIGVTSTLNDLGVLLMDRGRMEEAEALFGEALAIRRRLGHIENVSTAQLLANYGNLLTYTHRFDEAIVKIHQSLALQREILGEPHLAVALSLGNLAFCLMSTGRWREAAEVLKNQEEQLISIFGDLHPELCHSRAHQAVAMRELGKYVAAEDRFRQLLSSCQENFPEHEQLSSWLSSMLSETLLRRGRAAEAWAAAEAYALHVKQTSGEESQSYPSALNLLAGAQHGLGNLEEAEALVRQANQRLEATYSGGHRRIASGLERLGLILLDQGELDEAESVIRRALAMRKKLQGEDHYAYAVAQGKLAEALLRRGAVQDARSLVEQAIEVVERRLPTDHPKLGILKRRLGACLLALGRRDEAARLLRESHAILEPELFEEHPERRLVRKHLRQLEYAEKI